MQSLNMPLGSCGELVFLWAEMLRTVSSWLQLLHGKTHVCGGQAGETGGEEKHFPPSQLPRMTQTWVVVLLPLALSPISPNYTVPRSSGEE